MLRYKAIQIIKTLSEKELKEFSLFIKSPYYNRSNKVVKLFEELCNSNNSYLTNEYLMKRFKTQSKNTITDLFSELTDLCEKYLINSNLQKHKYENDRFLLYEYEKRGLTKIYRNYVDKFEKKLNSSKQFGSLDFFYKYIVFKSKYNFDALHKKSKNPEDIKNLAKLSEYSAMYLTCFCIDDSINTSNNFESRNKKVKLDQNDFPSLTIFRETVRNIGETRFWDLLKTHLTKKERITIDLLKFEFLLESNRDVKFINKVMKFIKVNSGKIDPANKSSLLYELLNVVYELSNCNKEMEEFEFDFYDFFLKEEVYISEGEKFMSLPTFKFFLMRGYSKRNLVWVEKYYKTHINKVYPEYRCQLENLYFAYTNFLKQNFKLSLEHADKVNLDFHTFKRDIKQLQIMLLYETGQWDAALYLIDSFRKFLANKELAPEATAPFKLFVNSITGLIKMKTSEDFSKNKIIRMKIENSIVASKFWLLEKLDEFDKN